MNRTKIKENFEFLLTLLGSTYTLYAGVGGITDETSSELQLLVVDLILIINRVVNNW